jgi:hypothetical protein
MPEFLARMNSQITPLRLTEGPLLQYIADRQHVGALLDVAYDGELPPPIERAAAPSGLGTDGAAVWFSTPEMTPETVARWYVNGAPVARKTGQYANSATWAELGAAAGDVVQVCLEVGGVVGWWARLAL